MLSFATGMTSTVAIVGWDNDELIVDTLAFSSNAVRQLWVHRAEFLDVLYGEIQKMRCATLEMAKRAVKVEV
jgi:salicylate hydroxylase